MWDSQEESPTGLVVGDLLVADTIHQKTAVYNSCEVDTQSAHLEDLRQSQVRNDRYN